MSIRTIRSPLALVNGAIVAQVIETFNGNDLATAAGVVQQPNTHPILSWIYYTGTDGDALVLSLQPVIPPVGQVSSIELLTIAATDSANASRYCYPIPLDSSGVPYRLVLDRTVDAGGLVEANLVWAFETIEAGSR